MRVDSPEMQSVLDAEVQRWSKMSSDELIARLQEIQTYEVDFESRKYQFEVQLLENRETYLHVSVCVMDGTFRSFIRPWSLAFICSKAQTPEQGRS